jgi:hypothetical protein
MILELRIFNKKTGRMVYMDKVQPVLQIVGAVPLYEEDKDVVFAKDDPIMIKTPILSKSNVPLWEGDVCDCSVVTSFGLLKDRGIIVWRGDRNQFTLQIAKGHEGHEAFDITDIEKVGNMYEHPHLLKKENANKTH